MDIRTFINMDFRYIQYPYLIILHKNRKPTDNSDEFSSGFEFRLLPCKMLQRNYAARLS